MVHFVGDSCFDHYLNSDEFKLGGCSLNVATHYRRVSQNETHLYSPLARKRSQEIIGHCLNEGITLHSFEREGELPCQDIEILESGEKSFKTFHEGILKDFTLTAKEKSLLKKTQQIVSPLYRQILPFIDQLIPLKEKNFIFDFHNAEDFTSFDEITHYLTQCELAQFGLGPKDSELIELLKDFAQKAQQKSSSPWVKVICSTSHKSRVSKSHRSNSMEK